jgi:hypothetical protein
VEQAPKCESWPAAATEAIEEALRRAEHLRLDVSPRDYGELVEQLDRLLEPLVAFEDGELGAW